MSDDLQRTEDWHAQRAGKWTGSKFVDVLARNKRTGEPLKAYTDLIWQVVVERMTGQAVEGQTGQALAWGTEVEPYAAEAYEMQTGNVITQAAFIKHHEFAFVGCSPDGLVGADGGLEMKCPKDSRIHLERFITGMPDDIRPQVQGCMWVTGRKWWDFVSYDPRMQEQHRFLKIRVNRDDAFIAQLQAAVLEAEVAAQELQAKLERIAA